VKYSPAVTELKRKLRQVKAQIDMLAPHGYCERCLCTDVYWHHSRGRPPVLADWGTEGEPHRLTCAKVKPSADAFDVVKE
jgi:hypothetical protein